MEIRLLFEVLKDRYRVFLLLVALAIVPAVLLVCFWPKVYGSTARVQVRRISDSALFISVFPEESATLDFVEMENVVGSLEFFMKSDELISNVIARCGLEEKVDFPPSDFCDPGLVSSLFRKRGVAIEAEQDSEIISVTGVSVDLAEARDIANTFVAAFLEYYRQNKVRELRQARARYERRAAELRADLAAIEEEELAYRRAHGLLDTEEQASVLLGEIQAAREKRYDLEADLAATRDSYDEILKAIAKSP